MADPRRLLDEGANEFESSLLRAGRRDSPRSASRRKIMAGLGVLAVVSSIATSANAALHGAVAGKSSLLARLAITGKGALAKWGVVSGAGALAVWAGTRLAPPDRPDASPPAAGASVPALNVPLPTSPSVAPPENGPTAPVEAVAAIEPSVSAVGTPERREVNPRSSTAPGDLSAELALLEKSRRALLAGDARRSLALIEEHGRRFSRPRLAAEAQVLRIEALVANGERGKAAELGRAFLARQGQGPFARRVRSLIGTEK